MGFKSRSAGKRQIPEVNGKRSGGCSVLRICPIFGNEADKRKYELNWEAKFLFFPFHFSGAYGQFKQDTGFCF